MIEVKNVKFAYTKEDIALRGVSFDVPDDSWVSIIGHNGSGKSTISKLIIGLIEPQKGEIFIDGVKLTNETITSIRKNIGIVFQNPDNQFVGVDVEHDIAFGLENLQIENKKMHELVNEYAKKVSMQEKLKREPHTLSGGEKQRVAIAGILALNQKYIILDEATSMLDPEGIKDVVNLVKILKKEFNKTIITITHDLNLAALSDKVIVLKDGKKILEGEPSEVFKEKDLLESSNLKLPLDLDFYNMCKNTELNNNKELMDTLWEYHLSK